MGPRSTHGCCAAGVWYWRENVIGAVGIHVLLVVDFGFQERTGISVPLAMMRSIIQRAVGSARWRGRYAATLYEKKVGCTLTERHSVVMASNSSQPNQSGFRRVTRQRRCLICGKPDWCSFSTDEHFSICMRIRDGAVKLNRHGGAIFINQTAGLSFPETSAINQPPILLAAPEIRDFVYRQLIRLSPATRAYRALVSGAQGLRIRGLCPKQWGNYGDLPPQVTERNELTRALRCVLSERFPSLDGWFGVPGFWEDETGVRLGQPRNYRHPWLVIPVRDSHGLIQACQLRRTGAGKGAKYIWLSSAGLPNGVGSGSPLHFTFQLDALPNDATITIVEGILKADVLAALRPDLHVIGMGGVAVSHGAVIAATCGRLVVIGFDQDYRYNEQVCWQLASLIAARVTSEGTDETTRIAVWPPRVKGMDDAALAGLLITTVNIADWLRTLSPTLQTVVRELWQARGSALLLSL